MTDLESDAEFQDLDNDDMEQLEDQNVEDVDFALDLYVAKDNPAPLLCSRKAFFKMTRQHNTRVQKQVKEVYLRDDLGYGYYYAIPKAKATIADSINYIAIDGNDASNDDDNHVDNDQINQQQQQVPALHSQVDTVVGQPHVIQSTKQLIALSTQSSSATTNISLIVVDTNVLLHHWDVIQAATNVLQNTAIIVPQTALEECQAQKRAAYERVVDWLRVVDTKNNNNRVTRIFFPDVHHVAMHVNKNKSNSDGNSTNDSNDAQLRRVAHFFATAFHKSNDDNYSDTTKGTDSENNNIDDFSISSADMNNKDNRANNKTDSDLNINVNVIFLTDDVRSRQLASIESPSLYKAMSVRDWVMHLEKQFPDQKLGLIDRVAQFEVSNNTYESSNTAKFPPHLSTPDLLQGIQKGLFYRGIFRGLSTSEGSVTIKHGSERVVVTLLNSFDCNRAIDGDVVAIALHPLEKWLGAKNLTSLSENKDDAQSTETTTNNNEEETGVIIASETAEPKEAELSNASDSFVKDGQVLRPTGKVVGIVRRNFGTYSGSILKVTANAASSLNNDGNEHERITAAHEFEHADGSMTCVFFPVNRNTPPILFRTTQRERLWSQRIVVTIDSWPANSPYPLGHYVRTIGPVGDKDVETEVLLQEYNIPYQPFSAAVLACLPPENYQISADNSPGRKDLRHLPVLSIDPPGCKDIDDALHCILLPNGNFQVGVHIADVTHYVKAGSAMDMEAASRSTSTYLVNKRLDMLPGLLTTDLCSLKGNVDRYAFSVLWEVTPEANIQSVEFHKTLIHSIGALTYQQAQTMIDQPDDPTDEKACAVKRLASLARLFRKRRIAAGALTLASPEVKFVLDSESLNPTDVQAYAMMESNALVEEFMLLANVTVSKKILRHYPTLSVLRRHPAPNRAMFDSLISKAKCRDIQINIEDSKQLADSLDAAVVPSDPYVNKLLRILSTRCMSPAQYFCSGEFRPTEWHHYGLAAPVYTHFTSPIRRYADVCVHRLLAGAIGVAPLPTYLSSKSYLHDLCANMNRRHRSAQMAGRASVQLHTLMFFANSGAVEEEAYVLDVDTRKGSEASFRVIVPRYGLEGRVKLNNWDEKYIERHSEDHKVVYKPSKNANENNGDSPESIVSIQVFDKVIVKVWVREYADHRRELVIDMVRSTNPSPHNNENATKGTVRNRESDLDQTENARKKTKKA